MLTIIFHLVLVNCVKYEIAVSAINCNYCIYQTLIFHKLTEKKKIHQWRTKLYATNTSAVAYKCGTPPVFVQPLEYISGVPGGTSPIMYEWRTRVVRH